VQLFQSQFAAAHLKYFSIITAYISYSTAGAQKKKLQQRNPFFYIINVIVNIAVLSGIYIFPIEQLNFNIALPIRILSPLLYVNLRHDTGNFHALPS